LFKLIINILLIGFTLHVEENAGTGASYHNDDYQNAGAKIVSRNGAYASNIILKVRQPNQEVCFIENISLKKEILFFFIIGH
jgi:alanine dehydrogenase